MRLRFASVGLLLVFTASCTGATSASLDKVSSSSGGGGGASAGGSSNAAAGRGGEGGASGGSSGDPGGSSSGAPAGGQGGASSPGAGGASSPGAGGASSPGAGGASSPGAGGAAGAGGSGGGGVAGTGGAAGCATPQLAWAVKLGDDGEAFQIAAEPAGGFFVFFAEPKGLVPFLEGCTQLIAAPSTKTGYFVARFAHDGVCEWSRWVGAYAPGNVVPLSGLGALPLLVADDEGVTAAVTSEGQLVRLGLDGKLVWKQEGAPAPNQVLPDGKHGVFLLASASGTASSNVSVTHLGSNGDVGSTWTFPLDLAGVVSISGLARGDGTIVLYGGTTSGIPTLGVSDPAGGLTSVFAAALDGTGANSWTEILGADHGSFVATSPVETADGALWFLGSSNYDGPGGFPVGGFLATRSPSGAFMTAPYDIPSDFRGASPVPDGSVVVAFDATQGSLEGKPVITENVRGDVVLAKLDGCGATSLGSTASWASFVELSPATDGFLLGGWFGGGEPGGACSPGSLVIGATTLDTNCRGAFVAGSAP